MSRYERIGATLALLAAAFFVFSIVYHSTVLSDIFGACGETSIETPASILGSDQTLAYDMTTDCS